MTPDFIDELHRAAETDDAPPPPNAYLLLHRAKRRDSRRRVVTAAGGIGLASAVVASVGVGTAVLHSQLAGSADSNDPTSPSHQPQHGPGHGSKKPEVVQHTAPVGAYTPTRYQRDEVLGACTPQLDRLAPEPRISWRIDPGSNDRLYYGGERVLFVGNDNISVTCVLPTTDRGTPGTVTEPIATEDDTAGILRQCGVVAGYDFTGWNVDSAMSQGDGTEAMLRSTNGWVATCALQPAGWDTGSDQEVDMPSVPESQIEQYRKHDHYDGQYYYVSLDASSLDIKTSNPLSGALLWGGATLFNHDDDVATDAASVTLSYQGESITRPVVNGHVAIRWLIPGAADAYVPYDVVVKDDSGNVLASYNIADQP